MRRPLKASASIVLIAGVFIFALSARAEDHRPKIGLALGGGGALGGAHLGVIKVLEENNIPIDYIAGTSMGSIVGGAYAIGMSPDEIEELLATADWDDLLNDRPSRENLPFRDKEDRRRLVNFEAGFKEGQLKMPRGAIAGQKLGFILKTISLRAGNVQNFDEFPIPFRAIATDIETGEEVVLKDGVPAEAIRASMAVPGAFSPVEIDGRVLVDGMLVNNVPIDTVREMGADIVIAVDVGSPLATRENLDSGLDYIMQMIGIFVRQNVDEKSKEITSKDILLKPDLKDMTPADFPRIMETVAIGESTAQGVKDKLKRYSVSDNEYKVFLARQRKVAGEIKIDFVDVGDSGRVSPEAIASKIKTKPGSTLDQERLKEDLTSIYNIGDFENVDFNIVERDGQKGLLIDAKEKSWGPHYLRFGFNITDNFKGVHYYNTALEHTWMQVNELGGELKNTFEAGRNLGVHSQFYQPLDYDDKFFIEPNLVVGQTILDIYVDHDKLTEYRTRGIGGGLDLGMNIGTVAQVRAGLMAQAIDAKPIVMTEAVPDFDVEQIAPRANFTYDQLDSSNFPRHGLLARLDYMMPMDELGSDESYQKIEGTLIKPVSYKKHTVMGILNIGSRIDQDIPFYDEFTMGGFLNLSGYKPHELRGQYKGYGALMYYYKIMDINTVFADGVYIGGVFEAGNVWDDEDDIELDDLRLGGVASIGVDTILGPLYLGYGWTEDGNEEGEVYLYLGRTF